MCSNQRGELTIRSWELKGYVVGAIIRFYRGEGSIPTLDVTCVCCWLSSCLLGCFSKSPTCFPSFHPSFIIQIPIKPKHSRQRTTQWMRCYILLSSVYQLLSMVADLAHFFCSMVFANLDAFSYMNVFLHKCH